MHWENCVKQKWKNPIRNKKQWLHTPIYKELQPLLSRIISTYTPNNVYSSGQACFPLSGSPGYHQPTSLSVYSIS